MSNLALVILSITSLFGILLVIKRLEKRLRFCAICVSVSLTWLALLASYYLGFFEDKVLVAILMGQSSLGIYYLIEKKAPKDLLVYRLPALTTLVFLVYWAISQTFLVDAAVMIALLWIIITGLYAFRQRAEVKDKVKALIECCSDW